jgi:endoglucanase
MPRSKAIVNGLLALLVGVGWLLAQSMSSRAALLDLGGFEFTAPVLLVNENAGRAIIVVRRTDTLQAAQVRYITTGITAEAPYDYTPVKDVLDFAAGQSAAAFAVPIVDHGVDALPKTIKLSLFGPSADGLGPLSAAILTIVDNDPLPALNVSDPLSLPQASTSTDPLAGAQFYVDPGSEAARAAVQYPQIRAIADEPGVARFGSFSYPNAEVAVARYLAKAQTLEPRAIPLLTTYRIVDGVCHSGTGSDTPAQEQSYESFITGFAEGIGSYRAVLFLEQDSLITAGCLSAQGLAVRMQELNAAIDTLRAHCPRLVIYLDAGAADAVGAARMASLLRRAGVAKLQGFFLDSTHFDWASKEIAYGERISRLTGGRHFVVNTGESGRGPLIPANRVKSGNEVLCNPPGRGLGPRPSTATGFRNVDAFAWLDNPGGSSGACRPGAPRGGVYWPAYALMLIQNADYNAV